jgi:hypothetical protein
VRQAALAAMLLTFATAAAGQDADPALRQHRLTISAGARWTGGYGIGDSTALLRRNEPGTTTPSGFTLFRADSSLGRATGFEARVAFALTRTLAIEAGGGFAKPRLVIEISEDPESPPVTLSDERLSQYTVEVNLNWQLPGIRLGRRARPYLLGGGGYLRQLYQDRTEVETGGILYAGGGIRYWLHGGDAASGAFGLRGEARVEVRRNGIEFAERSRTFPVLSLTAFVGF